MLVILFFGTIVIYCHRSWGQIILSFHKYGICFSACCHISVFQSLDCKSSIFLPIWYWLCFFILDSSQSKIYMFLLTLAGRIRAWKKSKILCYYVHLQTFVNSFHSGGTNKKISWFCLLAFNTVKCVQDP